MASIGKSFVGKEFYVPPPNLPKGATDEQIMKAWLKWAKIDEKKRRLHKKNWNRKRRAYDLPDFDKTSVMAKSGGKWKQKLSNNGIISNFEEIIINNEEFNEQ